MRIILLVRFYELAGAVLKCILVWSDVANLCAEYVEIETVDIWLSLRSQCSKSTITRSK